MSNKQKEITKKIRELLFDNTKACERVYTNQAAPTWIESLPALIIYPLSIDVSKFSQAPRELRHDIQLVIEIIAEGTEVPFEDNCNTVEEMLYDIIEQVKCIMAKTETLNDTADDNILTSIEFDFVAEGQKPVGSARMIYVVTFVEPSPKPTCPQDGFGDFELGKVDWDIGHHDEAPDDVIDAQDDIDFP